MNTESSAINRKILVIDDNRSIHEDFKKILQSNTGADSLDSAAAALFGDQATVPLVQQAVFELDSAFQGQEGLQLVEKSIAACTPYAMAFVDVRMPPGWDGIETIGHLWKVDPDLQVVICTAYSDYSWDEMVQRIGHPDRLVILKKPFDNIEVTQMAHAFTEKWALLQKSKVKMDQLEQMVVIRTHDLQKTNEKLLSEMTERQQTEEALRQSQKMDAVGKLAGGIAHDFNNMLTVILGYANVLLSEEQLSSLAMEALGEIHAASQRAINLTSQLLVFSCKQRIRLQNLNLTEIITSLNKMLHRLLGEDISVRIECDDQTPPIHADRAMIEQIVLNLVINARDAMPYGGALNVRTFPVEITEEHVHHNPHARIGSFVCISVADSGSGIDPKDLPHLFEPFFTTKDPGKGTGLGLATVYGAATQHHGWVEVESKLGSGATFKVFIPVSERKSEPPVTPHKTAPKSASGGHETILLVEDEKALCKLAKSTLQRKGYNVLTAKSGMDALEVWSRHGTEIDLLLTDIIMPEGVSGIELAKLLRAQKPELRVSFTSGYSLEVLNQKGVFEDNLNFLPKPYDLESLAQTARNCLDEPIELALETLG